MKSMMKLSALSSALALAGVMAFSGHAVADRVRADYISHDGGIITTNAGNGGGGLFKFDRQSLLAADTGSEFTGTLNTNGGPPGTNLAGSDDVFYAFCLEPTETLIDPHTYDVKTDLTQAPVSGLSGSMSAVNASDMQILFGNVFPDFSATIDTQTAIALQIAVWEIANEGGRDYNVENGNLVFTNQASARATAQGWLDNIKSDVWTTKATNLVALVDTSLGRGQDFVAQVVPIPAAAWLFGSALVGVAAVARRKKKDQEDGPDQGLIPA